MQLIGENLIQGILLKKSNVLWSKIKKGNKNEVRRCPTSIHHLEEER